MTSETTMQPVTRLLDRFTYIQKYVLDTALSINNYFGTPTYRVEFEYRGTVLPCTRNLIIDVVSVKGVPALTVYVHVQGHIVLLYNDNDSHTVDPALTEKFKNFEFVVRQFERFSILREPLIFQNDQQEAE